MMRSSLPLSRARLGALISRARPGALISRARLGALISRARPGALISRARLGALAVGALALAGGFVVAAAPSASALTTTLYVAANGNNFGGTSTCTDKVAPCATLAYAYAQSDPGDTIDIGPGTFVANLDLSTDVSLVGAEVRGTVLEGDTGGPVLELDSAGTPSPTIADLTVNGGGVAQDVDVEAGDPTLNNVEVTGAGGAIIAAIYVDHVGLSIDGGTIIDNAGQGAGGLQNEGGQVLLNGVSFEDNTSTHAGGGLSNVGGLTTLEHSSVFEDNTANEGGALFNDNGGTLVVESNSLITANTATAGDGGGIENCAMNGSSYTLASAVEVSRNNPNNIGTADPETYC